MHRPRSWAMSEGFFVPPSRRVQDNATGSEAMPTQLLSLARGSNETIVLGLGGSRTLVAALTDVVTSLRDHHRSSSEAGAHTLTVCRHGFSIGPDRPPSHNQRIEPGAEREYYRFIEACVHPNSNNDAHCVASRVSSVHSCASVDTYMWTYHPQMRRVEVLYYPRFVFIAVVCRVR